jgi:hypothetical protein
MRWDDIRIFSICGMHIMDTAPVVSMKTRDDFEFRKQSHEHNSKYGAHAWLSFSLDCRVRSRD